MDKYEKKKLEDKRIDILLKKYKGIKGKLDTARFKEPVVFMIRRTGKVEFFEGITQGTWYFQHSDGDERFIMIDVSFQKTFEYGEKVFRGYICSEDHPTPLPDNPITTTEQMNIAIEKVLNDLKEWKAKELVAKGKMFWYIAIGIGIVICAIILFKMLVGGDTQTPVTIIKEVLPTGQEVIKNVTMR